MILPLHSILHREFHFQQQVAPVALLHAGFSQFQFHEDGICLAQEELFFVSKKAFQRDYQAKIRSLQKRKCDKALRLDLD
jgi:hypothetical protein